MKTIKFCENNFKHGTEAVATKLKNKYQDITIEIEPCLGYCSNCSESPFAIVDDEFIQDDTVDGLYTKITK